MKTNLFKYIAVAGGLFIANVMFNSCSNEELISIDKIYIHSLDDTTTELSKVRLGQMIRIQGSGFSTTKAIYCNGVEISGVNTNYITDDCIILKIPSDLPTGSDVKDENVRNTIRIVTEYDEFVYKFDILAASPTITSVSHTLPRAGEWINIYGTSLKDIEYVTFPGGVNSTEFSVNEDYTVLSVKVPEGIGENYGELTVYGANGGAYSYSDFNFKSGQFIWQFSSDQNGAYNYGTSTISANLTDVIPTEGNGAKSPDCYRAIPKEPATTPKEGEIGGFNFYADKAIQIVLDANSGNGAITEKTKAVIVNSPNNPTGVILSEASILRLCDILRSAEKRFGHEIFLVSDEPYRELVYGNKKVPYLTSYYDDTIVCYSFSKSLSLPGERIGYILVSPKAASAQQVYAAVAGAGRALGFVCAPSLFQYMIPACLGKTSDISVYESNRTLLYHALTSYGYHCANPDGAFYLLVKTLEPDAYRFCETAKKYELLLVPSDDFGFPGYVRIAYCVTPEQIQRSLPAFRLLAEEYQNKRGQ